MSLAAPMLTHQWSALTSAEFTDLDRSRTIAVLPLGATEQHGPHLPLSVDADLADTMVAATCAHLPADSPALFLPVQRLGFSPEHGAFAGTLSLKASTVMALWHDIAQSVHASGVNKLLLFNTHGGHTGLMDVVTRELRMELDMLIVSASWFNLPLHTPDGNDLMDRFSAHEKRFGVHAGQLETAMMLAINPELVRSDQLADFTTSSEQRARQSDILGNGRSAKFAWAMHDLNPAGAAGNATAATPQDGRDLIDATGRAWAKLIGEIDRLPADTVQITPSQSSA